MEQVIDNSLMIVWRVKLFGYAFQKELSLKNVMREMPNFAIRKRACSLYTYKFIKL